MLRWVGGASTQYKILFEKKKIVKKKKLGDDTIWYSVKGMEIGIQTIYYDELIWHDKIWNNISSFQPYSSFMQAMDLKMWLLFEDLHEVVGYGLF